MHIFTMNSILDYIDHLRDGGSVLQENDRAGLLMTCVQSGDHTCYVHAGDPEDAELLLVDEHAIDRFSESSRILERLLQRVHRVGREFANPPVSLPMSWRKYQADNFIAFFALPKTLNSLSLRWIAENIKGGPVVFWEITAAGSEVALVSYSPNRSRIESFEAAWISAVGAAGHSGGLPSTDVQLRPTVDLQVVGASAVSRERPYSQWLNHLNDDQKRVLSFSREQTLKLRGIAGTGKTLTLQLKALHEVYGAVDRGEDLRVLILTHSWALADLIDTSMRSIDERGLANRVEVWPLAMAREYLHGNLPEGVEIVGEDGLEGKRMQMALVSSILDDFGETDWPTYRDRHEISDFVRAGVERETRESRLSLCWMLIREFAEVMDAHQIKPARDALQRYLEIKRASWMVQLDSDGDRRLFYAIFQRFVIRLVEEGQMTTDQAFDDFRKYLETYAWNIRRITEGFDLILVDEFHLFSDAERYLLHFLTRDSSAAPRMILALDPHQSPFVLLTGMKENPISRRSVGADTDVGYVDLAVAHRFSAEICRLVQAVQRMHPAILDEGDDWRFTIDESTTSRGTEGTPRTFVAPSEEDATLAAMEKARSLQANTKGDQRVALIAAGDLEFDALTKSIPESDRDFVILNSRDEAEQLNYAKKSIVLASSSDCAGLQFSHVVVLVFATREASHGRGISATRAAITDLYLAISRAEHILHIVSTRGEGTIPEILTRAEREGLLESCESVAG